MIYLDNSATTEVLPQAAEIADKYNRELFFNPSAVYDGAVSAGADLKQARRDIAAALGCNAKHLTFTSCGTESNNTALWGALKKRTGNIVTTAGEHLSVYRCAGEVAGRGYDVRFCRLKRDGTVDREHFLSLVDGNTQFISVIHVSNETGAVNDIKSLCAAAKLKNPAVVFHSDGVQAFLKIPTNLSALGVDMYSISGHKVHALKGIAALYSKVNYKPLLYGGGQEDGRRGGTENMPGIMALALCCNMFFPKLDDAARHFDALKRTALTILKQSKRRIEFHAEETAAPHILSFSVEGIRSEILIQMLSDKGIYIGSGSACSARQRASRVIDAIGGKYPQGTLRISFSRFNTIEEVSEAVTAINELIPRIAG